MGYTKTEIGEADHIVRFGVGRNTGEDDVAKRGGKGNKLFLMAQDGVNVPAGWTITTEACTQGFGSKSYRQALAIRNKRELISLSRHVGYVPLVSVRSGAPVSMPGMMDTILNVGMSDESLPFWTERIGAKAAADCYRRLIVMYGEVVKGVDYGEESKTLERAKSRYLYHTGQCFPQDMMEQLDNSVAAVFQSWYNTRAVHYRQVNGIPNDMGTAVNIQTMVFGNRGDTSGSGVLFSRDVGTGENEVMAEFLVDAQGEDVVAATATPLPFDQMLKIQHGWPSIEAQLRVVAHDLEDRFNDVQDIEFTVECGELYILQTRDAKRTGLASIVIARDFVKEGRLTKAEALDRVSPNDFAKSQIPQIDPKFKTNPMFKGIGACPGVVTGEITTSAADAIKSKTPVILVAKDTDVNDLPAMRAAVGVLTAIGGKTSHAAVVAREFNKPTVVGAGFELSSCPDGLEITIDGLSGYVWAGKVPTIDGAENEAVAEMVEWAFERAGTQIASSVVDRNKMTVQVAAWVSDKKAEKKGLKALNAMGDRSGIVLDIASERSFRREEDNILWDVFGKVGHDESPVVDLIDRLVDAKLEGAIVRLHRDLEKHTDRIEAAGYKVARRIRSLEDVIMSSGPMEWSPIANTIDHAAFHKAMELKVAAGEPVALLPESMTVGEAVFKAFKG